MRISNGNRKGFTLIELLIVIAILGILATAVLSAINPLEQIRKANDAGRKSDSAELLNALERYYTTFGKYPWTGTLATESPPNQTWLSELLAKDEIKKEFMSRKNLTAAGDVNHGLSVTEESGTKLVHVCFKPESKTFTALAVAGNKGVDGQTVSPGTHICVPE